MINSVPTTMDVFVYIKIYFIEIKVVEGTETCFSQRNNKPT